MFHFGIIFTLRSALISLVTVAVAVNMGYVPLCRAQAVKQFTPSLHVSTEYTNNVDLEEKDRESDVITLISPRFALVRSTRTSDLEMVYAPTLSLYAKNDEDNTLRQNVRGEYSKGLSKRLRLSLMDQFIRTEELSLGFGEDFLRDERELPPEQRVDATRRSRDIRYTNNFRVGLDYTYGKRDSIGATYSLGQAWDEGSGAEDSTRHSVNTAWTHWMTQQWGTSVKAGYTRGSFSGETDTFDEWSGDVRLSHMFSRHLTGFVSYAHTAVHYYDDADDYTIYDPGLGVDWTFAREGKAGVRVGYYVRDAKNNDLEKGVSVDADISQNWEMNKRTAFRLSGGSGYENTYFGGENLGFTLYTRGTALLTYALTRHTDSSLRAQYTHKDYKDTDPERWDDIYSLTGRLSHALTERLAVALSDSYRRVESNVHAEEYTENRIMLSLTMTPKGWRW